MKVSILIDVMGSIFLLIIGIAVFVSLVGFVFDSNNKNVELKKQVIKRECKESTEELISIHNNVQRNKVLELLLDGYEMYWQASFTVMCVEDLSLIVHHLEKENNLVEIIDINGFIIIFKKRCD